MSPLSAAGRFLGTKAGFAVTAFATAASCIGAFLSVEIATFGLSVIAIIIPAFILLHSHEREALMTGRDEAMHAKLDELIRATPANDALRGIEPKDRSGIENDGA